MVRMLVLAAVLAALATPALAGPPYTAPPLQPATTGNPPAALRADAIALLKAVQAGDLDAVGRFIAPKVTVISGTLDMTLPRRAEVVDVGKGGRAAVAALGQHTGGDWDLPPDAEIGSFLSDMELDFIEGALTDGQPWGTDPLLPGTICTYGFHDFDAAAVKRAADAVGVDGASFVMVEEGTPVLQRPGGRKAGTLSAGRLYATDNDTAAPSGWLALHLPAGGVGFIAVREEGLQKPYADGLCFRSSGGRWRVVGQASTGV